MTPGDALLFDYRVLHRGTLNNTGGARPVFVLTVAKPWFRDLVNFPKRALFPRRRRPTAPVAAAWRRAPCFFFCVVAACDHAAIDATGPATHFA